MFSRLLHNLFEVDFVHTVGYLVRGNWYMAIWWVIERNEWNGEA